MFETKGSWENKAMVLCKQCGRPFVRYVYEKLARCEECRRANRMAALPILKEGEGRGAVKACRPAF